MSESPQPDVNHTKSYDQFIRAFRAAQNDVDKDVDSFPFPRPKNGYICESCRAIPVELFLATSQPICVGKHARLNVCHGDHIITCDECEAKIEDVHSHCAVCKGGDYDICESCIDGGKFCLNKDHQLTKRFILKGSIVEDLDEQSGDKTVADEAHKGSNEIETTSAPAEGSKTSSDGPPPALEQSLQPYLLHANLASLLASAASGCHSCSIIVTWFSHDRRQNIPEDANLFVEPRHLELPPDFVFTEMLSEKILVGGKEPGPDEYPFGLVQSTVITHGKLGEERPTICPLAFRCKGRLGRSRACMREPTRRKTSILGLRTLFLVYV